LFELNYGRVERLTIILGLLGAAATFALSGVRDAGGFLIGALVSLGSFRSWVRIAGMLGNSGKPPGVASAVLLALRYPAIALGVYVTIKILGITPAALISGLLVSFAAVLIELVYGRVISS
jgi:hypothetical protein